MKQLMEIGYYKHKDFYIIVCDEEHIGTAKEYNGDWVYQPLSGGLHTVEMLEEIVKVVRTIKNMNQGNS